MIKRDDAIKAVVEFETPLKENEYSIGSGFFVRKGVNQLFIITASHVANSFTKDTVVCYSKEDNSVGKILLSTILLDKKNHVNADICALSINIEIYNSLLSSTVIYPIDIIDINNIKNISRDTELTSIGFPNGLGVKDSFQPLSFRSFPASNIITNVDLGNNLRSDIFIMENPSCGGYSGCPVVDLGYKVTGFMTQTSNTYIYGVMHGTISDKTGGKMAVVTPAYYILDLI